jgi:hypothetical protein
VVIGAGGSLIICTSVSDSCALHGCQSGLWLCSFFVSNSTSSQDIPAQPFDFAGSFCHDRQRPGRGVDRRRHVRALAASPWQERGSYRRRLLLTPVTCCPMQATRLLNGLFVCDNRGRKDLFAHTLLQRPEPVTAHAIKYPPLTLLL